MRLALGAVVVVGVGLASLAVNSWGKPKPARVAVAGPAKTFTGDVLTRANENTAYRRVLFSGQNTQLVLMSIPPGGDIGEESHGRVEQLVFCASGSGTATVNGKSADFKNGDVIVSTPGTRHNVKNTGTMPLKIYTIYSPPNHLDGRVQKTKADAQADLADQEFGRKVEQGGQGH